MRVSGKEKATFIWPHLGMTAACSGRFRLPKLHTGGAFPEHISSGTVGSRLRDMCPIQVKRVVN